MPKLTLVDVAPRDGIQNEDAELSTAIKCELIGRISAARIPDVEVASFVSPKWVPQMVDATDIVPIVSQLANLKPIVLAVNAKGYQRDYRRGKTNPFGGGGSATHSTSRTPTRQLLQR